MLSELCLLYRKIISKGLVDPVLSIRGRVGFIVPDLRHWMYLYNAQSKTMNNSFLRYDGRVDGYYLTILTPVQLFLFLINCYNTLGWWSLPGELSPCQFYLYSVPVLVLPTWFKTLIMFTLSVEACIHIHEPARVPPGYWHCIGTLSGKWLASAFRHP
jgi:hypothetical protein